MSTETLVWLAFILILIEYNFRLYRSSKEKIEEQFKKLKDEFLEEEQKKKAAVEEKPQQDPVIQTAG